MLTRRLLIVDDDRAMREMLASLFKERGLWVEDAASADAMPRGGELRVTLRPHGGEVEVRVADSGHGIPSGDLERVFEPFYTTKAAGEGSGLGLSVVQGIVADHHGAIEVTRSDDSGTEFRLLLPAS